MNLKIFLQKSDQHLIFINMFFRLCRILLFLMLGFVIVQSAFGTGTIVQLVTCECVAIELLEEIKHVRFIVDVE